LTSGERWLAALWPVVRSRLPEPPARVVDIGCGALGGFVPFLQSDGYEALGVDPEAPDSANYRRVEFERLEARQRFDAAIASTSLHHVSDPDEVIDRLAAALTRGGTLVVVEWASESFDEATARWCFERLPAEENWLHRRRDEWRASGKSWTNYLDDWATRDGIHHGELLRRLLEERFERLHLASGPYFFPDLTCTEADEQAAIDARRIRATRIDWVGACKP
jgi:SAM-dependent methyltransferase